MEQSASVVLRNGGREGTAVCIAAAAISRLARTCESRQTDADSYQSAAVSIAVRRLSTSPWPPPPRRHWGWKSPIVPREDRSSRETVHDPPFLICVPEHPVDSHSKTTRGYASNHSQIRRQKCNLILHGSAATTCKTEGLSRKLA